MRIAYIAPYQGPGLLKTRPILGNLGLAANVKMELVAELLRKNRHSVDLVSQGAVVERQVKFYPAFREPTAFDQAIPVFYASALPIRRVNGLWSALSTLRVLRRHHRRARYDAAIIYNLQFPQVLCAIYVMRILGLPVVLEYEDDGFVSHDGKPTGDWIDGWYFRLARTILKSVNGCMCVSPHLLSQIPSDVPRLLLRGVVSQEVLSARREKANRKNWVVFSGTHFRTKGIEQLVTAWERLDLPDWELHIAGHGEKTDILKKMAAHNKSIVFHGLLNREENAALLGMARIGMNPHDLSATPGNVFAFKIIEYLAAGNHVISTPMGPLEKDLEAGITYMPDNSPDTIAATLQRVIENGLFTRTAEEATEQAYGPPAVSKSLDALLEQVRSRTSQNGFANEPLLVNRNGRTL